jgi:hypothetical protein
MNTRTAERGVVEEKRSCGREPWLHGSWETTANVLIMDNDADIFERVTGGWAAHAPLSRI